MATNHSLAIRNRLQHLLSAAGSYGASGNYLLAWYYAHKAESFFKKHTEELDSEVEILRMRLTFMMIKNQYCEKLKLKKIQLELLEKAQLVYDKLYDILVHDGDWTNRQITQHMAERLKLKQSRKPLALTADLGYRNLGMPGMDIISIKDMVRSADPAKVADGLAQIDKSISRAMALGMYTETWKQSRLKILKQKLTCDQRKTCFKNWWKNLDRCEYYWLLRLHHILNFIYTRDKIPINNTSKTA